MMVGVVVLLGVMAMAQEEPTADYVALMQDAGAKAKSISQNIEAKNYDGIAADAAAIMAVFVEDTTVRPSSWSCAQEVGAFWIEQSRTRWRRADRVTWALKRFSRLPRRTTTMRSPPRVERCLVAARPAILPTGRKNQAVAT